MHSSPETSFKTNLIFFILNIISMHGTDAKVCCEILFIFPLNVNNSSSPHIIGRAQKGRHHNRSHNSAEIFYQDFKPEIFSNSIGTETRVIFLVWTDWQRILSAPQFCKFDFIILTSKIEAYLHCR